MLGREYDFVYLTNTPSFYKLNLCNEIAKKHSLLLVFFGYGSEAVNIQLDSSIHWHFEYVFLHNGDAHERNKLQTIIKLCRLMRKIKCWKILYAGWFVPEYNIYSFLSPRKKNVLICESSIFDISLNGIKGWIKQRIIKRMSAALPSGRPHAEFFRQLGFGGQINITGGVGIFNKGQKVAKIVNNPLRYIYVGRLIDVKNVSLLIEEFNRNQKPLTIVGQGILTQELRAKAHNNITFTGFIPNDQLGLVYQAHDVFILPSKYEPWGLVVEEAIYWGLPVIVSDKVGCSIDMVKNLGTGCIFRSDNIDSLHQCIEDIDKNYAIYKAAVDNVDFAKRDRDQINAYINLLAK